MKKKFRKAVFIVAYILEKNKPKYLLLRRKLHWKGWEFPKGGVERFETKMKAVKREISEETGLRIKKIKRHNFSGSYFYPRIFKDRPAVVGQTFSLYSVELEKGKVVIDKKEHTSFKWISYKEAMKFLTYKNQRDALKIVNNQIKLKLK